MQLTSPVIITSRLKAGVQIGKSTISIDYASLNMTKTHRVTYRYWLDLETDGERIEYGGEDIQSGCQGGSLQDGLESLLSFMAACGESYAYGLQVYGDPIEGENTSLFPTDVAEWCYQNCDELSMLACELEETPDCIVE